MSDRGRVRTESSSRRVRVMLGGEVVADTIRPLLVWEVPTYPTYYFPRADVRTELLTGTGETKASPSRGDATLYEVAVNGSRGEAYSHEGSPMEAISDHVAFVWRTMDHWFEEDEEVFVHARDPYTRVDIVPSSRHVRIEVDGEVVADTTHAFFLFETGLPTRYYIPKTDVRMSMLTPTDKVTRCPYKGSARYWTVTTGTGEHANLVWAYDAPLPESQKIMGLVSFYNEKVDLYVDEVLQERPKTKFS